MILILGVLLCGASAARNQQQQGANHRTAEEPERAYEPAYRPPVSSAKIGLTTPDLAASKGLVGYPIALPFPDDMDGTLVGRVFLQIITEAGGGSLSDLKYKLVFDHEGILWECEHGVTWRKQSKDPLPAPPPEVEGIKLVERGIIDWVMDCRDVTKVMTSGEWSQEVTVKGADCQRRPRFTVARRWEHQFQLEFLPPSWSTIFPTFTGFDIYERPPVCGPLGARKITRQQPHVIEATFYPTSFQPAKPKPVHKKPRELLEEDEEPMPSRDE